MPLSYAILKPSELTDLSRTIQADGRRTSDTDYWLQRRVFPGSFQHEVDYRIRPGVNGIPQAAKFRAWDAQAHIGGSVTSPELTGELLPLGERRLITEFDRLKLRRAGQDSYRAELARQTADATLAVVIRMEQLLLSTLDTGKSTLVNERGVTQEADWGRNPNRKANGAVTWTSYATSTPLDDLSKAQELVDRQGFWLMNSATRRMIGRSASLRQLASTNTIGTVDVVSSSFTNAVLADRDINVSVYDAKYTNGAGVESYLLPTGKALFVGGSTIGQTVWGVTREAMDAGYGIPESQWPGIVAAHLLTEHPIQDWINVAAVGFPVLSLPDNTFSLQVVF